MAERPPPHSGRATQGWCSLRVRFDEDELALLRSAERLYGSALARQTRPEALRSALALARAGQRLARASASQPQSLGEGEVALLLAAVRSAAAEVTWLREHAEGAPDRGTGERRAALQAAFPELVERGLWRAFSLVRALEALGLRLESILAAKP